MGQTRGRRRDKKNNSKQAEPETDFNADFIPLDPVDESANDDETSSTRDNRASFFGLLDRSELDYFKNAESMLATNALTQDEREAFIANVFVEARGKELKLATNQVCSKLLERLVSLANDDQLLTLVKAFEPFVVDLAFQKFSSHCLEAILIKAIPIEICESLIESSVRKLGAVADSFLQDKYASHVLSTVLLSLSGHNGSMRSKKSQLARKHTEIETSSGGGAANILAHADADLVQEVSKPLRSAAIEMVKQLTGSLDEVAARKLAIDPVGSPAIQAIIMAEASLMSSYTLVKRIALKDDSKGIISYCLSDSVGAHFLETVVNVLPAKKMNKFVEELPLAKLSVSEIKAVQYLVQSVISTSHLSKSRKLEIVRNELKPVLGQSVGITIAALDLDFEFTAEQITSTLDTDMLDLRDNNKTALIERLASYAPFAEKAVEVIISMDDEGVQKMGLDATHSYVLQSLLNAATPVIARRKLVNKLIPHIAAFVVNAFGSHIVDSLWSACFKLKFARERIANELMKIADQVKHSPYGRKVWKNWNMEKYVHKRHEWWQAVKAEEDLLREKVEPKDKKPEVSQSFTAYPSTKKRRTKH